LKRTLVIAQSGHDVTVFEKKRFYGRSCKTIKRVMVLRLTVGVSGFVAILFFADFGKKKQLVYELVKLSPAYRVYYEC
jgi:phytoene desaturase